jgi:hypothetical protein
LNAFKEFYETLKKELEKATDACKKTILLLEGWDKLPRSIARGKTEDPVEAENEWLSASH